MKKILSKITTLFICLFAFNYCVNAQTSIDMTKSVFGAYSLDNTFHYSITQKDTNPEVFDNLNLDFDLVFDENTEIQNRIAQLVHSIDFSNVNFTTLGRYEFVLTESSSNESVYPADDTIYTIIVTVLNELDDNNMPTGNRYIDVMQSAYKNDASKEEILFETRPLTYVTINKNVTGDLANINEYFKFKVELDCDGDNTFIINGQDSSIVYNGETINTSNVYDSSTTNYVYLKHGQTVTIGLDSDSELMQIPAGFSYTIEEMDASNYKTYINNERTDGKIWLASLYNLPEKNTLNYNNNYESTVLTGLFVNIVPFVLLIVMSIVGIVVVKTHDKKKYNTLNY